jgi:type II secretory pathway pseudopilin PulG
MTLRLLSRFRRRAYTLVELLLVIGVLGLAGAMLVPHLSEPDVLTVQAAVRRVISDISFAQSDALAQQEMRRLYFYDDGRGYVILRPPFDPDTDFIYDPLAPEGVSGAYIVDFTTDERFEGVSVASVELDGAERFLTFDEIGGTVTGGNAPGTGGTIVLETANGRYQITVAPFTGKLTVQNLGN